MIYVISFPFLLSNFTLWTFILLGIFEGFLLDNTNLPDFIPSAGIMEPILIYGIGLILTIIFIFLSIRIKNKFKNKFKFWILYILIVALFTWITTLTFSPMIGEI